jgi:hypothetical protein
MLTEPTLEVSGFVLEVPRGIVYQIKVGFPSLKRIILCSPVNTVGRDAISTEAGPLTISHMMPYLDTKIPSSKIIPIDRQNKHLRIFSEDTHA